MKRSKSAWTNKRSSAPKISSAPASTCSKRNSPNSNSPRPSIPVSSAACCFGPTDLFPLFRRRSIFAPGIVRSASGAAIFFGFGPERTFFGRHPTSDADLPALADAGSIDAQAVGEAAEAAAFFLVAHRLRHRRARADQHAYSLRPCNRRIDKVAPQHQVMALMHRHHDRRILAALALMHRNRIGERQFLQVGRVVAGVAVFKGDVDQRPCRIDAHHAANIAVEDLLVIVVPELDYAIAFANFALAEPQLAPLRIEQLLQLAIEQMDAQRPSIHRA